MPAALERLVQRGVLTGEQATIVLAELAELGLSVGPAPAGEPAAAGAPATPAAGVARADSEPRTANRSVGPVVEAAGYAGGVLAAAAGIALGSQLWDRLQSWAQVAVLALVALVLWVAGRVIADTPETTGGGGGGGALVDGGAASRLTGTLWLASTAATAAASGVAAGGLGLSAANLALLVGLALLVQGLLLWRARPGALQLLAPYAGTLVTLFAALEHLEDPPYDLYALLGWAVGVAGIALAWGGVLHPPRAAFALGALVALVSTQALAFDLGFGGATGGLLLGIATAVALLALARMVDQPVLTGLGAAGLAVLTPQLLSHLFPDSIAAPAALFLGGVGLLAAAIVAIRSGRDRAATAGGDRG